MGATKYGIPNNFNSSYRYYVEKNICVYCDNLLNLLIYLFIKILLYIIPELRFVFDQKYRYLVFLIYQYLQLILFVYPLIGPEIKVY